MLKNITQPLTPEIFLLESAWGSSFIVDDFQEIFSQSNVYHNCDERTRVVTHTFSISTVVGVRTATKTTYDTSVMPSIVASRSRSLSASLSA